MAKITLNDIGTLASITTAKATINANNHLIENAFENTLSRDGTQPNSMDASLDMNSNRIFNLPQPLTALEPLRYEDLSEFIGGGTVTNIPAGGSTGDTLVKSSDDDYDIEWAGSSVSVIGGANINISGVSPVTISTSLNPAFSSLTIGSTLESFPSSGLLVGRTDTQTLTNKTLTAPVLTTPALGTIASGDGSTLTGTAASFTAGHVTTNANLTGAVTSVGNATSLGSFTSSSLKTALTDETGSGAAVFATSPALVTPTGIVKGDVGLGNVDNTSDATKNAASVTLTNKTITAPIISTISNTGTLTLPTSTDTLVGKATTDTFTNKTFDTAGTGNSFSINSLAATANTGTGSVVRATSPTLVTPALGTPTAAVLTSATGLPLTTGVTGILPLANGGSGSSGGPVVTVKRQIFTANGTHTPSTGMLFCIVEAVGAGGGGGSSAGSAGAVYAGAGGSAGTYTASVLSSATVGASKAIVIGTAGTGGASGSNNGAAGTSTTYGTTVVTAPGGPGGAFGSAINIPASGAAAAAGTGDLSVPGGQGVYGAYFQIITLIVPSGAGANNRFGIGASGVAGNASAVTGGNGTGYGSGGSGGCSHNTTSNAAGGNGAAGLVIITEFCNQ